MMTAFVWVLFFLPAGDEGPPHKVRSYETQAQCEDVLDDIIRRGMAREDELKCIKQKRPRR